MKCSIWSGVVVGLVLMLSGCSIAKTSDSGSRVAGQSETVQIDSLMAALSSKKAGEIEAVASKVPLPDKLPFPENPELRKIYSDWFRNGYAYAILSGAESLRDQVARNSDRERAKAAGWFDGNSAGSLARRSKEMETTIKALTTDQLKTGQ